MVGALLGLCLIEAALLMRGWSTGQGTYGYNDADPWIRLTLVQQLHDSGAWYDHQLTRLTPPYGIRNHWTRPLDVVLLAGAYALTPWYDFKDALLVWSGWFNAFLLWGLALGVLAIGRQMGLSVLGLMVLALGVMMDPLIVAVFHPGRADHHSLLAMLFVFFVASTISMRRYRSLVSGVLAGVGIWVSPEFCVPVVAVLLYPAWRWVQGDKSVIRTLRHTLNWVFITLAVSLCIERRVIEWFIPRYDSISLVYVILWGCAALLAGCAEINQAWLSTRVRRLAYGACGAGLITALMKWRFPLFWQGPIADADPGVMDYFSRTIIELQPAWMITNPQVTGIFLIMPLMALVIYAWTIMQWNEPENEQIHRARQLFIVVLVMTLCMVFQRRWNYYVIPLSWVPVAGFALHCSACLRRAFKDTPVISTVIILVTLALPVLPLLLPAAARLPHAVAAESCHASEAQLIQSGTLMRILGNRPHTILTDANTAPQILYWTLYSTVASNYHNDGKGLQLLSQFYYAPDAESAHDAIQKAHANAVLICDNEDAEPFSQDTKPALFTEALRDMPTPDWLHSVTIPEADMHVKLFVVD